MFFRGCKSQSEGKSKLFNAKLVLQNRWWQVTKNQYSPKERQNTLSLAFGMQTLQATYLIGPWIYLIGELKGVRPTQFVECTMCMTWLAFSHFSHHVLVTLVFLYVLINFILCNPYPLHLPSDTRRTWTTTWSAWWRRWSPRRACTSSWRATRRSPPITILIP